MIVTATHFTNDGYSNCPVVKKLGRSPSPDSLVFKTVGLTREQWLYLDLWLPAASPTSQLRELFERVLKFWPAGPRRFRL